MSSVDKQAPATSGQLVTNTRISTSTLLILISAWGSCAWYMANQSGRLSSIEAQQVVVKERLAAGDARDSEMEHRITVGEDKHSALDARVTRMESGRRISTAAGVAGGN